MTFSSLILAGGRSARMGRDKAWLDVDGQPLLARQIALVRAVGASEVFISGRWGVDYSAFDGEVLFDRYPDAGPLAGVERGLAAASAPRLLVLAVDLPRMSADFLRRILAASEVGVVPELRGQLEPLAALYPKSAHALAVEYLETGKNGMQAFAAASGLRRWTVAEEDEAQFFNWNSP